MLYFFVDYWTPRICCHIQSCWIINYSSWHSTNYPCQSGSWCVWFIYFCVCLKTVFPLIWSIFPFSSLFFKSNHLPSFSIGISQNDSSGRWKSCDSFSMFFKRISWPSICDFLLACFFFLSLFFLLFKVFSSSLTFLSFTYTNVNLTTISAQCKSWHLTYPTH